MSDFYLILHKVRGEPAFDIAQKIMIGKEEGWIIPTSGHRAYPFHYWNLSNTEYTTGTHIFPDDWPDHYDSRREETSAMEELARSALMRRGLLKPKPPNNY